MAAKILKLKHDRNSGFWVLDPAQRPQVLGWWATSDIKPTEVHEFVFRANNRKFRVELVSAGTKS